MEIQYRPCTEKDCAQVLRLAQQWEAEEITYGYRAPTEEALKSYRLWCAAEGETLVGYLMGEETVFEAYSVFPPNTPGFEVEDLYVAPAWRGQGIGKRLLETVQQALWEQGVKALLLSTATKDAEKIRRFYGEKCGMRIWNTVFWKDIEGGSINVLAGN